jgi:hypothetical protein
MGVSSRFVIRAGFAGGRPIRLQGNRSVTRRLGLDDQGFGASFGLEPRRRDRHCLDVAIHSEAERPR